ncbi:hypothetical protein CSC12_4830 [Klebsiella michiganensis]|nr:hypothetical protein CSC12_4830 [Klebsiella michiganensis]
MRPARLGLPFIEAPGRRSGIKHLSLFSVVERVQEAGHKPGCGYNNHG